MRKYAVTSLGELLIDFTSNGESEQGNPLFEANPGGAPCNVLAMAQKLGKQAAFIGKVGDDFFGKQLKSALDELGICADALYMDQEVHTTLALVHTYPDGDRDFSFYRNPGADIMLTKDEVPEQMIKDSTIFHFGTLSSTHEGVREATRYAIDVARENGCWISFDPNLRPPLWKDLEDAKVEIAYGLAHCDILKISDNEITFMTGTEDYEAGIRQIQKEYNIPVIFATLGKEGSMALCGDTLVKVPGFIQENTIETTGAGDTFGGCALSCILDYGTLQMDEAQLKKLLTFANAGASIITTRKGALRVMPAREEIEALIAASGR